jgi:hypothetical protein
MRKVLKYLIALLLLPLVSCGNEQYSVWNDLINNAPKEIRNSQIITLRDINDEDNIYAFKKYNPNFVLINDFNYNGKDDIVIPCISKSEKNKWFIVIFEKTNKGYKYINHYEFNFNSIYVILEYGKDKKHKLIRVGQSFASDAFIYIYWNGKEYVKD